MSKLSASHETCPLSVVIATLGGESLANTIEHLNRGTLVPAEILVCIPEQEAFRAEKLSVGNVKVIKTTCRGQVAQRAVGFQHASHDLVLQLDDDIRVRHNCVERLVTCLAEHGQAAVGPKLHDVKTGKYYSFMTPRVGNGSSFERLLYWVINGSRGYEPGRIGRAGISMGIPEAPDNWTDLDWLPGGCVLHRRQNLVLFNFYPFPGKAFAEDLFHSVLLRKKGIKLIRCDAICDVDFCSNESFRPLNFLKWYSAYARALKALVREIGGSRFHLYLYLSLSLLRHTARRLVLAKPEGLAARGRNV